MIGQLIQARLHSARYQRVALVRVSLESLDGAPDDQPEHRAVIGMAHRGEGDPHPAAVVDLRAGEAGSLMPRDMHR